MSEDKKKRLPFMDAESATWWKQANQLARSFCPPIHPCADCGGPVIKGYCCQRCGSAEPLRRSKS